MLWMRGSCGPLHAFTETTAAMNFIVIVSDTFRYDYLGANGNAWIKTPELDAFSRIAVNFDRCTISSFPTIPTRTDWFTGRYGFPFHGWQPLDPKATVLAQVLRETGYVNQLITDNPHLMNGTPHFYQNDGDAVVSRVPQHAAA